MTRTRGRRPLACHHEAGHAVARWWLGFHSDDAAVLTVEEVRAGEILPDRKGRPQRCEGLVNGYDIHMPFARETLAGQPEDRRAWFAALERHFENHGIAPETAPNAKRAEPFDPARSSDCTPRQQCLSYECPSSVSIGLNDAGMSILLLSESNSNLLNISAIFHSLHSQERQIELCYMWI